MRVIDPGHVYELDSLDGEITNRLKFVKREGNKYPGNKGEHPGTTMQEVLRVLIHRAKYVNNQITCHETEQVIRLLANAIYQLEIRAAKRHGRLVDFSVEDAVSGSKKCKKCGHIGCKESQR